MARFHKGVLEYEKDQDQERPAHESKSLAEIVGVTKAKYECQ